jgi:hypothetical protein
VRTGVIDGVNRTGHVEEADITSADGNGLGRTGRDIGHAGDRDEIIGHDRAGSRG